MKIIYLAWGSLLWNHKNLKLKSNWKKSPIHLPLNFSRVSDKGKGRLTLVIDNKTGVENNIYYAETKSSDLNKAINNLKIREKTSKSLIGYINLKENSYRTQLLTHDNIKKITKFAQINGFDAVIWTDIPPNFEQIFDKKFSKEIGLKYIDNKRNDTKMYNKILEYIFLSKVYGKIKTPLSEYVINKLICNL